MSDKPDKRCGTCRNFTHRTPEEGWSWWGRCSKREGWLPENYTKDIKGCYKRIKKEGGKDDER